MSLPIIAALLAVTFVPAPAAAADETCPVQFETHDWQRASLCASVKGDCKAYWKHEGVRKGTECLYEVPLTTTSSSMWRGCTVSFHVLSPQMWCQMDNRPTPILQGCLTDLGCGEHVMTCHIASLTSIRCYTPAE